MVNDTELEDLSYWCRNDEVNLADCNEKYRNITPIYASVVLARWQSSLVFLGLVRSSAKLY